MKRLLTLSALLTLLCGCTGQWTDDPKNWKRAFSDSAPPEGVTIVHSFYRLTRYEPREEDWAFELKLSPERRKLMFENFKLRPLERGDTPVVELLTTNQPRWFLPKSKTSYNTWVSTEQYGVYVGAFEDKESGNIFLTADAL
jgi:hypothetical protein